MQATGNTFEIVHDPWKLYIGEMQYGSLGYDGGHGWDILQERYIAALLFECAATLGLVDVAYTAPQDARPDFRSTWGTDDLGFLSRYDGLSCLRLNALGAFILGAADRHDPATPTPAGGVFVLPNLDVVAAGDRFSPGDEAFLSQWCPLVVTPTNAWDQGHWQTRRAEHEDFLVAFDRAELRCQRAGATLAL